jgi:AcrR family transcriptional regulator
MLDAAVRVFARRGFHAASMDEIADEAGISKPMVYAYLGAKDELFLACVRREATRLLEALAEGVQPFAVPDEQLWNGLRAVFGFVATHHDGWLVLYRQSTEPFAGELRAMRGRIIELVVDLLESACLAANLPSRSGDLVPLAHALVGAAESMADWLADHPEEDPEVTATRMMNLVWLGAGTLLDGRTWRRRSTGQGAGLVDGQSGEDHQNHGGRAGLDGVA